MSILTISRRWIASSHSSRLIVKGPLDRVPIRTKRGWISERSRSMSLAHKASRHWRSTDSISSQVWPPLLPATHQPSDDFAQQGGRLHREFLPARRCRSGVGLAGRQPLHAIKSNSYCVMVDPDCYVDHSYPLGPSLNRGM